MKKTALGKMVARPQFNIKVLFNGLILAAFIWGGFFAMIVVLKMIFE